MTGDNSHINQNNNYQMPYNDCAYDKFNCDVDPDYHNSNAIQSKLNSNNYFFSDNTFNSTYGRNSYFTLFHLNIRTLHTHYNELLCYLDTLDIELKIISLSETALNNSSINYTIPNYTCEINYKVQKKGGGVGLYIHNMFQYNLKTDLQLGEDVNSVFIEILNNSSYTKLVVFTDRHKCLYIVLMSFYHKYLVKSNTKIHMFCFVGDFNVNTITSYQRNSCNTKI